MSSENFKNILIDLVPVVYLIRSRILNRDCGSFISQNICSEIEELLLSLDSQYSYYESLEIVQHINNLLIKHLSIDNNTKFNENQNQEIFINNFLHCRGIEPVRIEIMKDITKSISLIRSSEQEDLLKQSSFNLNGIHNNLHKKQKSSGYFTSFDFDNLPDYEPLENTLQLLRNCSHNEMALQKLLTMDLEELFEHPQWCEVIDILQNSLLDTNSDIAENYKATILLLYLKYVETFNGNFQGIDVTNRFLKYLIIEWVDTVPLEEDQQSSKLFPLSNNNFNQLTKIKKVQIIVFMKIFDIFSKSNSFSSNQKEGDVVLSMLFILISKGKVSISNKGGTDVEYIPIFKTMVVIGKDDDIRNAMKRIMKNYHPMSVISYAISCDLLTFIINNLLAESSFLTNNTTAKHEENMSLSFLSYLLLAKYFVDILSPFRRHVCIGWLIKKSSVLSLSTQIIKYHNIDNLIEPVVNSNKRFYQIKQGSSLFDVILYEQNDQYPGDNIIFEIFQNIIQTFNHFVDFSPNIPSVEAKDIGQVIKAIICFCHNYDSTIDITPIINLVRGFNLKYLNNLRSKNMVDESQSYFMNLLESFVVFMDSLDTDITDNDNIFIISVLPMILEVHEHFTTYISLDCQQLSLNLWSSILNRNFSSDLIVNNKIFVEILNLLIDNCFSYVKDKKISNKNLNSPYSQIDDQFSFCIEFILNVFSNERYVILCSKMSSTILAKILNILIEIIGGVIIFSNSQLNMYLSQIVYCVLNVSSVYGDNLILSHESLSILSQVIMAEHKNPNVWENNNLDYYTNSEFSIIFQLFAGWILQGSIAIVLDLWIPLIQSECCSTHYQLTPEMTPVFLIENIDEFMSYGISLYFLRLMEISFADQNFCFRCINKLNKISNIEDENNNDGIDITITYKEFINSKINNFGFCKNIGRNRFGVVVSLDYDYNYKSGFETFVEEPFSFKSYFQLPNMKLMIPWDLESVSLNQVQSFIYDLLEKYQYQNISTSQSEKLIIDYSDLGVDNYFVSIILKLYYELFSEHVPESQFKSMSCYLNSNRSGGKINHFYIFCSMLVKFDKNKLSKIIQMISEQSRLFEMITNNSFDGILILCVDVLKRSEMKMVVNISKSIGLNLTVLIKRVLEQWFVNYLSNEDIIVLTSLTITKGIQWPVLILLSLLKKVVDIIVISKDSYVSFTTGGIELFYKVLRLNNIKLSDLLPCVNELYNCCLTFDEFLTN